MMDARETCLYVKAYRVRKKYSHTCVCSTLDLLHEFNAITTSLEDLGLNTRSSSELRLCAVRLRICGLPADPSTSLMELNTECPLRKDLRSCSSVIRKDDAASLRRLH